MTTERVFSDEDLRTSLATIDHEQAGLAQYYSGGDGARQPVHTVYGGAHLFKADTARKMGELALRALADYAPTPADLVRAVAPPYEGAAPGLAGPTAERVYARVADKLRVEPVEDFRLDFEDGYGNRSDEEEDDHARSAADELAKGLAAGSLPPFTGIRIKPFTGELGRRSLRTLDLFVSTLVRTSKGRLPPGFVVTLPKVTSASQVALLASLLGRLEGALSLPSGALKLEFMVEVTQAILQPSGVCPLPSFLTAAGGRCVAAHFGTYDYTASCEISAAHQTMNHPACDFARHAMKVAYAGTGIWLSDGATNVMPVGPHRAAGRALTDPERRENEAVVHRAWRLHWEHTRHSLVNAFYQGWDLHPAQLPTRYAAVYSFFLESLAAATERLQKFVEKAAQATLVGDVFDDAATGQGLLNFFLRGLSCGAVTEQEALRTGLTKDELSSRSFVTILRSRRERLG